eukprot:764358-Hanusia_phi.AAC.1
MVAKPGSQDRARLYGMEGVSDRMINTWRKLCHHGIRGNQAIAMDGRIAAVRSYGGQQVVQSQEAAMDYEKPGPASDPPGTDQCEWRQREGEGDGQGPPPPRQGGSNRGTPATSMGKVQPKERDLARPRTRGPDKARERSREQGQRELGKARARSDARKAKKTAAETAARLQKEAQNSLSQQEAPASPGWLFRAQDWGRLRQGDR